MLRDEIAAINRHAQGISRIADELRAGANDLQHAEYQAFLQERRAWERDQAAIAEYESWLTS